MRSSVTLADLTAASATSMMLAAENVSMTPMERSSFGSTSTALEMAASTEGWMREICRRSMSDAPHAAAPASTQLVHDLFLPAFDNQFLRKLDDQAVLDLGGARIAFTTDSFVVTPVPRPR